MDLGAEVYDQYIDLWSDLPLLSPFHDSEHFVFINNMLFNEETGSPSINNIYDR